jgi:hypothetical protein
MVKNKFNDQIPYLVIVGVVAVVAIVTLVLNGNASLHGADTVIIQHPAYVEPDPVIVDESLSVNRCVDQDEGLNDYYTKNYVQVAAKRYYDFCQGDYVREIFCAPNTHRKEVANMYLCEFGCEQGACLRQPTYG